MGCNKKSLTGKGKAAHTSKQTWNSLIPRHWLADSFFGESRAPSCIIITCSCNSISILFLLPIQLLLLSMMSEHMGYAFVKLWSPVLAVSLPRLLPTGIHCSLVGQHEKSKSPWHCTSTVQHGLKHPHVTSTVSMTNPNVAPYDLL